MTSMQAALQHIEDNGKAFAAMRNRVQNDPRYRILMAYSLALDDAELLSAAHVMASLTSSRHYRSKRAGFLAEVRAGQVRGQPGYTQVWLDKAAACRRWEVSLRAPVTLNDATAAFCAALVGSLNRRDEPAQLMAAE